MQPSEKKDMLIFSLVFLGLLILAGIFMFRNSLKSADTSSTATEGLSDFREVSESTESSQVSKEPSNEKTYTSAPKMILEQGKDYQAIIKTNKGDIKADLFENQTPITVNNFVFLSKDSFYNNVKFHRIIKGFMIQGGDPLGTGSGGPGYQFDDEPFEGEYSRGTLAMANAGPNTNGSQFFIMHEDVQLPKDYVIFGRVTDEGSLSVVDAIANTPTVSNGFDSQPSKPAENVFIQSVEIIEL